MFGFLIKKAFFDMWDNMLSTILLNLGFVLMLAVVLYTPYLLSFSTPLSIFGLAVGIFLFNWYTGTASMIAADIADYKTPEFKSFPRYAKEIWKSSLALSIVTGIQVAVILIAFPFYASMGGILGLGALSLIFWITVIWQIAAQYFFPVRRRLDNETKKVFRKCFVLFFDNTLFSLALGIGTLIIFVVSSFTAFLLPGLTTVLIWQQAGLKLRLYKYDYLEEEPEAVRKKIPWGALLIEDKERVGPRTFRGMIFPWKE
jgi:uncharacterized membrane protein YesL